MIVQSLKNLALMVSEKNSMFKIFSSKEMSTISLEHVQKNQK